jgi:hypothetical protein
MPGPAVVFGALFMRLPVHPGGPLVEDLHAVHAAVALAGVRIAGEDHRESDEPAAVLRPTMKNGVVEERKAIVAHDLLARALRHCFRKKCAHLGELRQHLQLAYDALGHAHFEELDDASRDLLDGVDFERELHFPHRRERVDQDRNRGALGLLEEQGGAALLDGAVGKFGDLEDRIHFERNALQLLVLLQGANEIAQIAISHYYEYGIAGAGIPVVLL